MSEHDFISMLILNSDFAKPTLNPKMISHVFWKKMRGHGAKEQTLQVNEHETQRERDFSR